jgi:hypothetical protein
MAGTPEKDFKRAGLLSQDLPTAASHAARQDWEVSSGVGFPIEDRITGNWKQWATHEENQYSSLVLWCLARSFSGLRSSLWLVIRFDFSRGFMKTGRHPAFK